MRRWFLNSWASLLKRKFLLASLKTLNYSKDCTKSETKISVPVFLLSLFDFSQVYIQDWLLGILRIRGGFRKKFRVKDGYQKAGTSFLNRHTGRILTICKWFYRIKRKLYFEFSGKICENHQRAKSTVVNFLTFKKICPSWHYPFKQLSQLISNRRPSAWPPHLKNFSSHSPRSGAWPACPAWRLSSPWSRCPPCSQRPT